MYVYTHTQLYFGLCRLVWALCSCLYLILIVLTTA